MTKDWSKFDGNSSSVVRTEALTSQDLDYYLRKAYRSWEWHRVRRALTQPRFMKSVLRHPIQGVRNLHYGLRSAARA